MHQSSYLLQGFLRIVIPLLYLFSPILGYSSNSKLADLKKSVLESQYIFTSEISQFALDHEVELGKKLFLTNRVTRERFRVAGKSVMVFWGYPQTIEPIRGLKSSYSEVSYSNIYHDLTDDQGEVVLAFTPTIKNMENEERLEIEIHFINTPKNYTEHINRISLRVYDPEEIKIGFFSLPILWGGLFLLTFLLGLGIRFFISIKTEKLLYLTRFSSLIRESISLFPYLALIIPTTWKEIVCRQVIMILIGIIISFLLHTAPLLLIGLLIIGILIFRQQGIPILFLVGLLLLSHLFLKEFYLLKVLPEYISKEKIAFLVILTIIATSPALLGGITVSAWLQYSSLFPHFFIFPDTALFFLERFSLIYAKGLMALTDGFLVKDYFFLFLLSIMLTVFTIGYRLLYPPK